MSINKRDKHSQNNVADVLKDIQDIKEGVGDNNTLNLNSLIGKSNDDTPKDISIKKQNDDNIQNTVITKEDKFQKSKLQNELVQPETEDFTMKRSYALKPSTYLKLQELKVFELAKIKLEYATLNYNDIVDMAICEFYNNIKAEIAKAKE